MAWIHLGFALVLFSFLLLLLILLDILDFCFNLTLNLSIPFLAFFLENFCKDVDAFRVLICRIKARLFL